MTSNREIEEIKAVVIFTLLAMVLVLLSTWI